MNVLEIAVLVSVVLADPLCPQQRTKPPPMTDERYKELESGNDPVLSDGEIAQGWHWCLEFDLLLVGPGMTELRCCTCLPSDHPARKTIPDDGSLEPGVNCPFDVR